MIAPLLGSLIWLIMTVNLALGGILFASTLKKVRTRIGDPLGA